MRRRLRARLQPDDKGSALVLSLMVVLLVGSLFAAAIDFTRTGLLLTPVVRNDRNEVATIQSAVDGAINNIRGSSTIGKTTTPSCPDFVPPHPAGLQGVDAAEEFRVTCSAQATGSATADGVPSYAIHALGTAPEGIRQVNPSNAELVVTGGIYSRGVIAIGGGAQSVMSVTGSAISETAGGCTGALITTDLTGPRCDPSHALADGSDPGYGPGLVDQAALEAVIASGPPAEGADPVPTCSGNTANFYAGYYGERPDVLLAKTQPTCSASIWRFEPGAYYFDYPGVWDLGARRVVFGVPTASTTLGAACNRTASGAHLVFGGESRVSTQSSAAGDNGLEICGPIDARYYSGPGSPQRIAVYGLTSANSLGTSSPGSTDSLAADLDDQGGWLNPENARTPDGSSAGVVLQRNTSATLVWSGFGHAPKGVRVTKVTAELTHLGANVKSASLRITGPGGVSITRDVAGCTTCSFDITPSLESRRTDALWRYLTKISATYEVKGEDDQLPLSATASLVDGIKLVVDYTTPALSAQTCPGTGCRFFESTNNPNVFIHGTVYTPASAWSVNVHNAGETIFDRGIVLRDLAVNVSGSTKQTSSPFQLPHSGSAGRKVLFRGWVNGVERVRACVRYTDQSPLAGTADTQAFAGYSLSVTQWLVFNDGGASAALSCPS